MSGIPVWPRADCVYTNCKTCGRSCNMVEDQPQARVGERDLSRALKKETQMTSSKVNLTFLSQSKLDPEKAVKTAALLAGVTRRAVRKQLKKALLRNTALNLARYEQLLDMPAQEQA